MSNPASLKPPVIEDVDDHIAGQAQSISLIYLSVTIIGMLSLANIVVGIHLFFNSAFLTSHEIFALQNTMMSSNLGILIAIVILTGNVGRLMYHYHIIKNIEWIGVHFTKDDK
jgi:hypothetical protein